jgi:hypothetical protein
MTASPPVSVRDSADVADWRLLEPEEQIGTQEDLIEHLEQLAYIEPDPVSFGRSGPVFSLSVPKSSLPPWSLASTSDPLQYHGYPENSLSASLLVFLAHFIKL